MVIGVAVLIFAPSHAVANQKINAAVVAGFILPFEEIAAAYENKTGVKIEADLNFNGRREGWYGQNKDQDQWDRD